jgi:hypothetical protein
MTLLLTFELFSAARRRTFWLSALRQVSLDFFKSDAADMECGQQQQLL